MKVRDSPLGRLQNPDRAAQPLMVMTLLMQDRQVVIRV